MLRTAGSAVTAHRRQGVGAASFPRNRLKTGDGAGFQPFRGGLGAYSWDKAPWSLAIPVHVSHRTYSMLSASPGTAGVLAGLPSELVQCFGLLQDLSYAPPVACQPKRMSMTHPSLIGWIARVPDPF